MRRRTLLGGGSTEYVFSAQSTSVSVNYNGGNTSVNIKSTADGENIGYTVVSYNTPVTAVTTAATYVTIRYSANSSTSSRSGTVVLKQNGSNNIITITVKQYSVAIFPYYEAIVLDAANGSTGSTFYDTTNYTNVTALYKPDWIDYKCSRDYYYGVTTVTATSANNSSTARQGLLRVQIGESAFNIQIIQMPSSYSRVDGHEYVTIGDLKWAIKNVGASSIADGGNYYQYGKGAADYSATSGQSNYSGTESPLASSADTATQVMGGGWRTPTHEEVEKVFPGYYGGSNCYYARYNGQAGCAKCSSSNATTTCLFFPLNGSAQYPDASNGLYWTSTPLSSSECYDIIGVWSHTSSSGTDFRMYQSGDTRRTGCYVRGVHT